MKRHIEKFPESQVQSLYPIAGRLNGWYFRLEETSNNYWRAEGTDLWGRKVACDGSDEEALLSECIAMAKRLILSA